MKDSLAMAVVIIAIGLMFALIINSYTAASIKHGEEMCRQTPECAQRLNQ